MTLTTEQLRARAKFWREKAVEVKWESVSIAQDMLQNADAFDELAANREAQPVEVPEYLTYLKDPIISNVLADDDNSPMANAARILAREVKFWRSQPLFTAPPAPTFPERLPCPVRIMPGLLFGKGVPTESMLNALNRREEYEAELEAMAPEQRAENDARLERLNALIPQPSPPAMPGIITASMAAEKAFRLGAVLNSAEAEQFAEGWNACRAVMLHEPKGI